MSCRQAPKPTKAFNPNAPVDLRITEEPFEAQAALSRRMSILTAYLQRTTGLNVRYVPSINYVHSYALLERGEVDLVFVGIYGGHRLLDALPNAIPLVVQKPSYRLVMLGRRRWTEELSAGGTPSLDLVQGRRVGFGSRFSGSTYLQPLLAMQEEGLNPSSIEHCLHEPIQKHLPAHVADGLLDFVFVPSFNGQDDQFIPESLRDELAVVWVGTPRRNDYLVTTDNPEDPSRQDSLRKVQNAFLAMHPSDTQGRQLLESWGYSGWELPTPEFPGAVNQRIDVLLSRPGQLPSCEAA